MNWLVNSAWKRVLVAALLWYLFSKLTVTLVTSGQALLTLIVVVAITIVLPVTVTYIDRKRPFWKVLVPSKQSWAFMFGDPFFLAPALAVTSFVYSQGHAPVFAYNSEWQLAMFATGLFAGLGLTMLDRARYIKNDALNAYDRPDKIIHDRVVVPVLFCSLLTTAVPLLFQWTIYTTIVVALLAVWAVLIVIDDKFRFVDPKWQYDLS